MRHLEVRHPPTIELHHHDVLDTVAVAWTGMTRRGTQEPIRDPLHHNLRDEEKGHIHIPGLLHALRPDVVVHLLEVHLVAEEEVQATVRIAAIAEVAHVRGVAVQVGLATAVGDRLQN